MELREAITNSYLVRGLSPAEFEEIVAISEQRTIPAGGTLVRQFEKSSDLMIIMHGGARINTFSGGRIVELGPGAAIGEIALLDEKPRSATVTCIGDTTVAVVPGDKLRAMMKQQSNIELVILRNLTRVLCDHIRLANMQLEGFNDR